MLHHSCEEVRSSRRTHLKNRIYSPLHHPKPSVPVSKLQYGDGGYELKTGVEDYETWNTSGNQERTERRAGETAPIV